ncbi:hypothetical protein AI27_16135 [Sphingomonas sp. BHC-A]|nr:hypothetical protein AI27_16135 [Sphingomonas sp. BHC-A]
MPPGPGRSASAAMSGSGATPRSCRACRSGITASSPRAPWCSRMFPPASSGAAIRPVSSSMSARATIS